MSSEQPKLNNSEVDNNSTSGEPQQAAPQQNVMASQSSAAKASITTEPDESDETRTGGDVDFGQLLDQFEQEQATLEEGEVVRGTVVGLSERGVVVSDSPDVELFTSLLFSLGCSLDIDTPVVPGNSQRVDDLIALHKPEQSAQVFAHCRTVYSGL